MHHRCGQNTVHISSSVYGIAAGMAFLKLIFYLEMHPRIGPILFCIRQVFWDIATMVICYLIAALGFGVALVSIFGPYKHEHFGKFQSTFKRLFWILFDPGKHMWHFERWSIFC